MKSWKFSIGLLAFLLIFEVLIPTQPVTAKSCPGENRQDSRSIRYKWRQNRCEGVVGYNLSATPFLISLSLNALRQFNQTATLEVKSLNNTSAPDVRAVAFLPNEYYLVDNLQLSNFRYFTWDAQILNRLSIQPQLLWLLAKSATGVYLPVQLGGKSFEYKFVFMSNSEVNFTEVEIRKGNQIVRKLNARLSQPARQPIIFRWDGRSNNGQPVQAGQYIFSYKGYSQQGRQIIPHSDSFLFEHDNQWLSP